MRKISLLLVGVFFLGVASTGFANKTNGGSKTKSTKRQDAKPARGVTVIAPAKGTELPLMVTEAALMMDPHAVVFFNASLKNNSNKNLVAFAMEIRLIDEEGREVRVGISRVPEEVVGLGGQRTLGPNETFVGHWDWLPGDANYGALAGLCGRACHLVVHSVEVVYA